jgi:hypothetical protein
VIHNAPHTDDRDADRPRHLVHHVKRYRPDGRT